MPHASLLRAQRQQMADDDLVGGVVAVAPANRTGEVEHRLDAPPHAARRHRLVVDQRFEGLEHQPTVDCRNGKIAEHWIHIARKRGPPLLAVLGIAPLARVDGEIVLGALPERHLLGALGPGGERSAVAGLDRVEAAGELSMAIGGAFWPNEATWKNQPARVGNDRRPRSIVQGLLFTINSATPTCRAVSARAADAARKTVTARARRARAQTAPRSRSTSSATRWPSIAAGIPQ